VSKQFKGADTTLPNDDLTQDYIDSHTFSSKTLVTKNKAQEHLAQTLNKYGVVNTPATVRINGYVVENMTLTAEIEDLGGVPSDITYQWYAGANLVSEQSGNAFPLTQNHVGKKIKVRVLFVDSTGVSEDVYSDLSSLVANVNDLATIRILGNAIQGEKLSADVYDLDGVPNNIAYRWYIGDDLINWKNGSTLFLTQDYVGKKIKVRATFTDSMGASEDIYSELSGLVANVNDVATIGILGNVSQGETLETEIRDLDGVPSDITYQWYVDTDPISGQNSSTLSLTQNHVGKTIKVQATFTDSMGASESVYSAPSNAVANVNDLATISILGNAIRGETLSAHINDIDGVPSDITYQWYVDDNLISGQSSSELVLIQAYIGKNIKVRAIFTDSMGASEDIDSTPTALVVASIVTGYFKGSAVKGLKYVTATDTGITDTLGTYKYKTGEHIKFYLGGLYLGKSLATGTLYPSDIANSNQKMVKITQLLQTLDVDSDPSNGIDVARFSSNTKEQYLPDGDLSQEYINRFGESKILVSKENAEQFLTTQIENDRSTAGYTGITTEEGEYNFTFPSTGRRTFEIPTLACGKVNCCMVRVFKNGVAKNRVIVDRNRVIRFNMQQQAEGMIVVRIRAASTQACYYKDPIATPIQTLDETKKTIVTQGQNGNNITLDILKSNQSYYLQSIVTSDTSNVEVKTIKSIGLGNEGGHIKHTATQAKYLDKEGVDAHANSIKVYRYLKDILKTNSYNDADGDLLSITNYLYPRSSDSCGADCYPGSYFNAFSSGGNLYFTPPKPERGHRKSLSYLVDVVAHEWGHSITGSFSKLAYLRQSGALNEAFSDWFGISVKQHYSTGEKIWTLGPVNTPNRSMSNPSSLAVAYGKEDNYKILNRSGVAIRPRVNDTVPYPDTYKGENWRTTDEINCPVPSSHENDVCGVHYNSSVANKMFYLLSVGGTHNGTTVTGIGIDNAMKIALDANKNQWTEVTTFHDAKAGMIASAGSDVNVIEQVKRAWEAINVLDSNKPAPNSIP
ncbi:M4 family metallopeptidase, partial [Bathymodiolus thermophilus thioautotrophic gill symbiont]|uniref:M4 family metallopeptidase n=1 Tax=Bathymodiolus thermophilus thioautotrophic gill symbiont TaxID=2360 RepID=UPI00192A9D01